MGLSTLFKGGFDNRYILKDMCIYTYEIPLQTIKGEKKVFVEVLNACKARFNTSAVVYTIKNSDNNFEIEDAIIRSSNDNLHFTRGKFAEVLIDNVRHKYYVNKIELINNSITISEKPYNQTTRFLLPSLGYTDCFFGLSKFLLNSFLKFKEDGTLILQLHYRFMDLPAYFKVENNVLNLSNCVGYNSVPNSDIVTVDLYSAKLNEFYEYFKEGKYSYFPDAYKKQIIKFHTKNSEYYKAVLYKKDEYRKQLSLQFGESLPEEQELHSIPELEKEFIN